MKELNHFLLFANFHFSKHQVFKEPRYRRAKTFACHHCGPDSITGVCMWQGSSCPSKVGGFLRYSISFHHVRSQNSDVLDFQNAPVRSITFLCKGSYSKLHFLLLFFFFFFSTVVNSHGYQKVLKHLVNLNVMQNLYYNAFLCGSWGHRNGREKRDTEQNRNFIQLKLSPRTGGVRAHNTDRQIAKKTYLQDIHNKNCLQELRIKPSGCKLAHNHFDKYWKLL